MKHLIIRLIVSITFSMAICSCRTTVATKPVAVLVKRAPAPYPGYVWVDGGWYRSRAAWIQTPGYWIKPRGRRVFVPGKWKQTRRGYYWKKSHWR